VSARPPDSIERATNARVRGCALACVVLITSGCYSGGAPNSQDAGTGYGADDAPSQTCSRVALPSCPPSIPSYAQTVAPILANRCEGCHFPGSTRARTDLSTYAGVFANRGTVLNQVYGCVMPPSTETQLSAEEKTTLMAWLVCGAPNN
jgi:hypothetical protein